MFRYPKLEAVSMMLTIALAIYSPAGTVVHTGDFKVDYTPVFGDAIDLQRFPW